MRRGIVWVTAMAVCCAMQVLAQQAYPHSSPEQPQPPHVAAKSAATNAPPVAEALDATSLGSPLRLDKGWRVGVTANPEAAMPGFDDSAWAIRNAEDSFADLPEEEHSAGSPEKDSESLFVWFRLHMKLAPNHGPVSLLIHLPSEPNESMDPASHAIELDIFANGRQIRPGGPHSEAPERYEQISRIYDLNIAPSVTSLTLAVRSTYVPFGATAYTHFFANRTLRLGAPEDLAGELELWSAHRLLDRLPRLINALLLLVLSVFLLMLYRTQKGHVEYLWLALYEAAQVPIELVNLAGSSAQLDTVWYGAAMFQLLAVSAYLYFEFVISFLALRKRWYISVLRYSAPVLAGIAPGIILSARSKFVLALLLFVALCALVWIAGWLLFILITLIRATIRRNFEAGLLLLPLMLSVVASLEPLTGGMIDRGGGSARTPLLIQAGLIPIHFASIADFTGIFVIVLIIFFRFLRIQHEQERASSELAAARSVQELMIPRERLKTPGFEVDSIYNPANEVGGDFYHVQPDPDGSLLVVIGDVAGKGLKAAMNVSMLMGALRRTTERSPAKILESLNRVLVGSESFTTCQSAWFGANGELVLANAGHLPPYLNSQEIAVPASLPLGVLAEASYSTVSLYLHPGDRILLLSDGVVEARRPSGELFGFDRVHNLSNQSAFYIADAAMEFGQEDDITVLTIKRLAQAMAA